MNTNKSQLIWGIVALVVVIILVVWVMQAPAAAPVGTATTTTTGAPVTPGAPSGTQPTNNVVAATSIPKAIAISTYLKKDATNVYLYSDTNPSGVDEYSIIPDADPATFVALSSPAVVEKPSVANGSVVTSLGNGSVAYYKDRNRVYILSYFTTNAKTTIGIQVIQGATPASFKVLSPIYTKDAAAVYALEVPPDSPPRTSSSYTWHPYDVKSLTDVDVASFVLVSNASLNYDAHDKSHTYRAGNLVGNYP
jgi:hypothetical protein